MPRFRSFRLPLPPHQSGSSHSAGNFLKSIFSCDLLVLLDLPPPIRCRFKRGRKRLGNAPHFRGAANESVPAPLSLAAFCSTVLLKRISRRQLSLRQNKRRNAMKKTTDYFKVLAAIKGLHGTVWTRIGTAFPTNDGRGYRLKLDFCPASRNVDIVILPPTKSEGERH
jgi:hypothetical protein